MNETLKLILDLVVRNARGGKQVADDVRRLRVEATGSSRPLNTYEKNLDRVGRQALKSAGDVAKLRREIQDTNRIVLTDKRGAITGVAGGAASGGARGASSLSGLAGAGGTLLGGIGFGAGAFGAAALTSEAIQLTASIIATQGKLEGLSATLGVLGDRFGVSQAQIAGTETRLKSLGLTTVQSRESIRDFTRAGASQEETVTLVGLAMDAAARQGLTLDNAFSRLQRGLLKAEPELLDELGIVINLTRTFANYARQLGISNVQALTTEQRSRAMTEALVAMADAGGEFAAVGDTVAGSLLRIDQAQGRVHEGLSNLFRGPVLAGVQAYEAVLLSIESVIDRLNVKPGGASPLFVGLSDALAEQNEIDQFRPQRRSNRTVVLPKDEAEEEQFRQLLVDIAKARFESIGQVIPKPVDPGGLALAGPTLDARSEQQELAKELREKLDPVAQRLIESLALEKLDGLARIRADRDQTLGKLQGASPALLAQIRAGFEAREVRELIAQRERQGDFEPLKGSFETRSVELDANAQFEQSKLIQRVRQVPGDIAAFNQGRVRQIEQIADAEERIIQLRSRDGSEIRDVLAIRLSTIEQIADIEGETARVVEGRLQAQLDASVQLAQLERDRLDRGRQAAESAFDALVSGGSGGFDAFLKAQVLGIGRTVTGNLAEQVLANSGTLGLDGLIGGQTKDGKLSPIGKLLQGTALGVNPADLQRENITALSLNTSATERLTAALSGRGGSDGSFLTPLRKSIGDDAGFLGLDWLRESSQVTADAAGTTSEATKETNQLLAKIVQTSIFGAAGAAGIAGGVRRGGVAGAVQTGAGIASTAGGILSALKIGSSFAGPLAAIGLGASLIGSFFGGQDPLKREKQIQDELNRNRFNAPESINREFDTFGRSVESGPNGVRIVNVNVTTMDAKSFMDNRAMIGEAARVAFNEDGGATYSDFRREFEG